MARVGIVMGSDSDMPVMAKAAAVLEKLGVDFEMTIISAHREPDVFFQYAKSAEERGYKVIIAGAGKAAHLPGMCAALFPMPVIFAIMLNEMRNVKFMKFVQTISYLPHFVSTVVLVSMITTIVSPSIGSLARLTKLMGGTPINYLSIPEYFVPINVISGLWQGVGWGAVIYVSTLAGIDRVLYEAAKIDGANRWQQILHVSLPGLAQTFVLMLIMQVGQLLNVNFEKVYLLQNTLNLSASEMLPTFVYKTGMESHNYGYATAAGLFNSVISVLLVLFANTVSNRVSKISLF